MSDTKTKICGITSPEDAVLCRDLGADYLGLVFAESPRKITSGRAREIREAVPEAEMVGVFSDTGIETVIETARRCRLDLIQLHGREQPEFLVALSETLGLPVIKVLRVDEASDRETLLAYRAAVFFLFDLEKGCTGSNGGLQALWNEAAEAVSAGHDVFLAGALTPENVGEAVKRVRPYCVDVCGGVEAVQGRKDAEAVRRFIEGARK